MNISDWYEKTILQGVPAISTVYATHSSASNNISMAQEVGIDGLPWFYTPFEVVSPGLQYSTPDHDLPHTFEYHTGSCISANYYLAIHTPRWAQTDCISAWCFHKIIEYEDGHTRSSYHLSLYSDLRPCCISTLLRRTVVVMVCCTSSGCDSIIWLFCLGSKHLFVPCGTTWTPWLEKITQEISRNSTFQRWSCSPLLVTILTPWYPLLTLPLLQDAYRTHKYDFLMPRTM
jgi:hypothetical protein